MNGQSVADFIKELEAEYGPDFLGDAEEWLKQILHSLESTP